jgi:hypothetical protein
MIEGDNLEVLQLLQKSRREGKLIYIDPPITPAKDFVCPTASGQHRHLTDEGQVEGGKRSVQRKASGRSTDWLNMMQIN